MVMLIAPETAHIEVAKHAELPTRLGLLSMYFT